MTAQQNAQLRLNCEQALKAAVITESQLAEDMDVARNTLSKIGRSPAGPQLATFLLVADKLDLYSIDELLGRSGTGDMVALSGTEPPPPETS